GSRWGYSLQSSAGGGTQQFGLSSADAELQLSAGATYTLNGSFEPGLDGSAFAVTQVTVGVATVNTSLAVNVSAPAVFDLTGAANVTLTYSAEWWLAAAGSAGGSVSPGSGWVTNDSLLRLSATPAANNVFLGWTGFGPGSSGSSQRWQNPLLIRPTGPVTELAAFGPRPPPTFALAVNASGIPADQPFSVTLGGSSHWGASGFSITNLTPGPYALGLPYSYDNGSSGVRYRPLSWTSTLSLVGGSLDVEANGSLNLVFATDYLLQVESTPGGSTIPSGATWQGASTPVTLVASPSPGYRFVGWNGTGLGARSSATASLPIVVGGLITEVAQFALLPPPPPQTFTLHVTESGLPGGTPWNTSAGNASAGGASPTLELAPLNGRYIVAVPIVSTSAGVRYVPGDAGRYPVDLRAGNRNLTVNFTEQVWLTISAAGNGSVGPGSTWSSAGTPVQLSAAAQAGQRFLGWTGTGPGSYTGAQANVNLTPTGPVAEVASFGPESPTGTASSASNGVIVALVLWVVAGVALLGLVGLVLWVGRRAPPAEPDSSDLAPEYLEEESSAEPYDTEPAAATTSAPEP
ncbi:MAG: hypothetical protein L3K11_08580, partial [Thermoplasmata archaeon]|nr:hypothetical protein [Thermoplasmata archaeon]